MRRRLVTATLAVAALGAAGGRVSFIMVAVVPAAVLAAGAVATPPRPQVSVARTLTSTSPALGERVRVRVAVTNDGPALADCRIADAPPDGLDPIEPTRRRARLPAGETALVEYAVVARRGRHSFGPVRVTARGLHEASTVEAHPETTIRCRPANRPLELGGASTRYLQGGPGEDAGSGVEFHAVREYHPSDPQRRVDWRRYARTRELTTVQFREESAERVHLLVDTHPSGGVRGTPAGPSAVAYCADAVERLAAALGARGTLVSVGLYPDAVRALPPGNGPAHEVALRRLLDRHAALPWGEADAVAGSAAVPDGGLPEALEGDSRVLLVSPCLDDDPVEFAASATAAGIDVGVLAPDVGGAGPGATVERALRADRLARLDGLRVPLVDWDVDVPLERAVAEVFATWT